MILEDSGHIQYKRENKKTAIVSLSVSLSYYSKNYDLKAQDLFYLREYLQREKGREVDFVTKKTYRNPQPFFKDFFTTDLNDYDEVIIHNSSFNTFFGGVVPDIYEQTLLLLSKYKGDVWYYLIDPRFGFTDYAKYFSLRINSKSKIKLALDKIKSSDLENFSNNIVPKVKCLYAGINYSKHKEFVNSTQKNEFKKEIIKEWDSIPIHEFWAANLIKVKEYKARHKKYDIVYYGVNRKSDRNKLLDSLFKRDEQLRKLWIGYDPHYPNSFVSEFLPREELNNALESSYSSIVAGDKLHFGNIRTLRFFESLSLNTVALMYEPYIEDTLIKDEKLKNLLIFKDIKDIKNKIEYLKENKKSFEEILEMQKDEFKTHTEKFNYNLKLQKENTKKLF